MQIYNDCAWCSNILKFEIGLFRGLRSIRADPVIAQSPGIKLFVFEHFKVLHKVSLAFAVPGFCIVEKNLVSTLVTDSCCSADELLELQEVRRKSRNKNKVPTLLFYLGVRGEIISPSLRLIYQIHRVTRILSHCKYCQGTLNRWAVLSD